MKGLSIKQFSNNKTLNKLTHNKFILYILLALTLFNLVSYLGKNNLYAVLLFLTVGIISTRCTKNMVLVLLISIIVTNLLVRMGFLRIIGLKEGMKDSSEHDNDDNDDNDKTNEEKYELGDEEEDIEQHFEEDEEEPDEELDNDNDKIGDEYYENFTDKDEDNKSKPKSKPKSTKGFQSNKNNSIHPASIDSLAKNQENLSNMVNSLQPMLKQVKDKLSKINGN